MKEIENEYENADKEWSIFLKNNPEFIQQLKGYVPKVDVHNAKQRLFKRIRNVKNQKTD